MNYARRYTQAQSETASPERLMVLLFDAGLRHMHTAANCLDQGRAWEADPSLTRAGEIVSELIATLDPSRGAGDLCAGSQPHRFAVDLEGGRHRPGAAMALAGHATPHLGQARAPQTSAGGRVACLCGWP